MENLSSKDYEKLLDLPNLWQVNEALFNVNESQIELYVEYVGRECTCPECKTSSVIYDRRKSRKWRHLDTMQYETYLFCRLPRIECKNCNKVLTVEIPWSTSKNGFTLLFEDYVISQLLTSRSIEETREFLNLNWRQVNNIKKRAVERGLNRRENEKIDYVGIDEKSFRKGHKYVSLLNDLDNSRVLEVVENRDTESAKGLLNQGLTKDQQLGIKAVAMDMWKPYMSAVKETLSSSDIVYDYFHISKYLNDAVDKTRRVEHRNLLKEEDESLKGHKYDLVRNSENIDRGLQKKFKQLRSSGLKTARAWAIKELFRGFWNYQSRTWAKKFFNKWYSWAIRSRIKPIKKVAIMIKKHLDNILNFFEHRITNAKSEGINSKIQTVKSNSRGFHSFDSFRNSILFYCGKLDLLNYHTK